MDSENMVPVDVLRQYGREYINDARRKSYARHPERVMRQRLTCAANLLNRYGLIDEDHRASLLERIKAVTKE